MKKVGITFLCLLFLSTLGFSQSSNSKKISIDLHFLRYATTAGLAPEHYYIRSFSYLNGFSLVLQKSKQVNYTFGIRKIKEQPNFLHGTFAENTTISGAEFSFGLEYLPGQHNRFYFGSAVQTFAEITKHRGIYLNDYQPHRSTVHLYKMYYGLNGRLSLHFRLTKDVELWAASRFQLGRVHFRSVDSSDMGIGFTGYRNKWRWQIDPLHSFALRFHILK